MKERASSEEKRVAGVWEIGVRRQFLTKWPSLGHWLLWRHLLTKADEVLSVPGGDVIECARQVLIRGGQVSALEKDCGDRGFCFPCVRELSELRRGHQSTIPVRDDAQL